MDLEDGRRPLPSAVRPDDPSLHAPAVRALEGELFGSHQLDLPEQVPVQVGESRLTAAEVVNKEVARRRGIGAGQHHSASLPVHAEPINAALALDDGSRSPTSARCRVDQRCAVAGRLRIDFRVGKGRRERFGQSSDASRPVRLRDHQVRVAVFVAAWRCGEGETAPIRRPRRRSGVHRLIGQPRQPFRRQVENPDIVGRPAPSLLGAIGGKRDLPPIR